MPLQKSLDEHIKDNILLILDKTIAADSFTISYLLQKPIHGNCFAIYISRTELNKQGQRIKMPTFEYFEKKVDSILTTLNERDGYIRKIKHTISLESAPQSRTNAFFEINRDNSKLKAILTKLKREKHKQEKLSLGHNSNTEDVSTNTLGLGSSKRKNTESDDQGNPTPKKANLNLSVQESSFVFGPGKLGDGYCS